MRHRYTTTITAFLVLLGSFGCSEESSTSPALPTVGEFLGDVGATICARIDECELDAREPCAETFLLEACARMDCARPYPRADEQAGTCDSEITGLSCSEVGRGFLPDACTQPLDEV